MKIRLALALSLIFATPLTANATYISGVPDRWSTPFGEFEVTTIIGGGGANAISAAYDANTEIFQLSSNSLPGFVTMDGSQQFGNVVLSLTSIVSNTGEFKGGAYSMLVGPAGVTGLPLPTGSLLFSGQVLELASTWSTIESPGCGGTCYISDSSGRTPALLALDFAAPELNLSTAYLTLTPFVQALSGIFPENPWSTSFESGGYLGWTLFETVAVPEPGALVLFAFAVAALGAMRPRTAFA